MSMRQDTGQRRSTPDGAWRQRRQTQLSGTRSGTLVQGQSVSDSSTATSLAAASWRNWDSRNYALPIMQRYVVSTARSSIVMNIYSPAPVHYPLLTSHGDEAIRHVVHMPRKSRNRTCAVLEPQMRGSSHNFTFGLL